MNKRFVSILLIVTLVFSFAGLTSAKTVSDIQGHWAEQQLQSWVDKGLIEGYDDGTFNPDGDITRAEFIALVNRSFGLTEKADVQFTDLSNSHWAYDDIRIAAAAGYISGDDEGTMRPDAEISRQEVAKIISSLLQLNFSKPAALSFADADKVASWSEGFVSSVAQKGLMVGYEADNTFQPEGMMTRAEAVVALDRSMNANVHNEGGTYGPAAGVETVAGDVTISAPGVTLKNTVITGNLTLAASIGEGDANLDNVTVKGTTTVNGGGSNSVHVKNSVLVTIVVDKATGTVRIVAEGSTTVATVVVKSSTKIEEAGVTGSGFSNVDLSSELPKDSIVTLLGAFETLNISSSQIQIDIPEGSVNNVTANESATGASINLGDNASIVDLVVNAVLKVIGGGTIDHATVSENVQAQVTFETKPTNVDVQHEDGTTTTPTPAPTPTPTTTPNGNGGTWTPTPEVDGTGFLNNPELYLLPAGQTVSSDGVPGTVYQFNVNFGTGISGVSASNITAVTAYFYVDNQQVGTKTATSNHIGQIQAGQTAGLTGTVSITNQHPAPNNYWVTEYNSDQDPDKVIIKVSTNNGKVYVVSATATQPVELDGTGLLNNAELYLLPANQTDSNDGLPGTVWQFNVNFGTHEADGVTKADITALTAYFYVNDQIVGTKTATTDFITGIAGSEGATGSVSPTKHANTNAWWLTTYNSDQRPDKVVVKATANGKVYVVEATAPIIPAEVLTPGTAVLLNPQLVLIQDDPDTTSVPAETDVWQFNVNFGPSFPDPSYAITAVKVEFYVGSTLVGVKAATDNFVSSMGTSLGLSGTVSPSVRVNDNIWWKTGYYSNQTPTKFIIKVTVSDGTVYSVEANATP